MVNDSSPKLGELEAELGYRFKDRGYLEHALIHRSAPQGEKSYGDRFNERLEFLGDAVIGMAAADFLYQKYPDKDEGELTQIKALLVSRKHLARRALQLDMGRFMILGRGEEKTGGRQRLSILGDALEAVVGAVYLDGGYKETEGVIHRLIFRYLGEVLKSKATRNYKSTLLEYLHARGEADPIYILKEERGPDNDKYFLIEVNVGGGIIGKGGGRTKKEASQRAAQDALKKMEIF
ncbi:ribonuclease III [candidate division KSB1 bacterium]|nr:ribonuclease III [candidate division KSB1 bacterium]